MPFQTITNFSITQAANVANSANLRAADVNFSNFSNFSREINIQKTAQDSAWREWLDNCPRYPDGCFSCAEAMLESVHFCRAANSAAYGADVIEVEMLHDDDRIQGAA